MSAKPKGRPPGTGGGKKLEPLSPGTVAMLAGTIPTHPPSEVEVTTSKAVFRTESLDPRLGQLIVSLHFAMQVEAEKAAAFRAMSEGEERDEAERKRDSVSEYVAYLVSRFSFVSQTAILEEAESFFEQVAYAMSVLKSIDEIRLCVADAWRLASRRNQREEKGTPTAALVTEIANDLLGAKETINVSRAIKELKALGLPYSRSGAKE